MKGQTAMEYLMTYGWAILIVIVVVVALYVMGVFEYPNEEIRIWCEQWCGNITTEEYTRRQSTVEEGRCICKITVPVPTITRED